MNYTKEQKMEMLREIWIEANNNFCREMEAKRNEEAQKHLDVMNWVGKLEMYINN